ncbi:hypothetical protein MMC06_004697 [Schaereria dolodes]|nr:hypothetical protein [Schaereria dolodes]
MTCICKAEFCYLCGAANAFCGCGDYGPEADEMWRRPVRPGIFDEEYGSEGAGDEASYENYREETDNSSDTKIANAIRCGNRRYHPSQSFNIDTLCLSCRRERDRCMKKLEEEQKQRQDDVQNFDWEPETPVAVRRITRDLDKEMDLIDKRMGGIWDY